MAPQSPSAFQDRSFLRIFGILAILFLLLGWAAVHLAWPPVPRAEVVGTYRCTTPLFLPVQGVPQQVVLRADGTMDLQGQADGDTKHIHWTWDAQERLLRCDDPVWDRRFRMRSTLMGPRLCVRICATPLLLDQEERDEEVDLLRTSPAGRP